MGIYLLNLALVIESFSSWTLQDVQTMVLRTNKILTQCNVQIEVSDPIFYFGKIAMDYDSIGLANLFYQQQQKPVVFLIADTQYNGSAGWAPGSHYVFVSSLTQTQEYKQKRHPEYETLAHELGHMLGSLPHLASGENNLMAGYLANQSAALTQEQCLKLRAQFTR
jgi:hypothetical protein